MLEPLDVSAPSQRLRDGRAGGAAYVPRQPETTPLYATFAAELETFLAQRRDHDRHLPRFVERELRAFLDCGILAHGFLRVRCPACRQERLVPFSCKGRGFCPSCGGRRMADTAAFLVDRVFPEAPVRQWVLTLPFALRYRLAFDKDLCAAVLRVFVRAVFGSLRRRARRELGVMGSRCGAVTVVQRAGDALNLNLHFHTLALDGVFEAGADGAPRFLPLPPLTDDEVERLAVAVARRIARLLVRRGLGSDDDAEESGTLAAEPWLAALAAAVRGCAASGPRAGQPPLRLGDRIDPDLLPDRELPLCARVAGLSLHAAVAVPARDRRRLERLCRYVARPPLATERLSRLDDGRLLYRLRHRWRDGTTALVFAPSELIERLAALVPPPRAHLVRYHGVLAPAAAGRALIVPSRRQPHTPPCTHRPTPTTPSLSGDPRPRQEDASEPRDAQGPSRYYTWHELMQRVFAVDVLICPQCVTDCLSRS